MCFRERFQKNPRDFMNNNIVTSPNNPVILPQNKIVKITIEKNKYAVISNKLDGNVFSIVFEDTPYSVDTYWCPYIHNDIGSIMLGTEARYVFTVSMNACSFGIGGYSDPGVVRVSHANAANAANSYGIKSTDDIIPAIDQQRRIQQHLLFSKDSSDRIITYKDYMGTDDTFDNKHRATTFGELSSDNRTWKFYTLKYLNGMSMEHKGVLEQF